MATDRIAVRKTTLTQKAQLMSGSEIERTLVRLAHEILEKNSGVDGLGLVGIRRRGVPLAERLGRLIQQVEKKKVPVGTLDITFYRDDLSTLGPKPVVQQAEIGFPIEGKKIVLIDDVLYTGRTTRAALDALFSHGRPSLVQLLVLIDRGHRELPIEATFIGRTVQTTGSEVDRGQVGRNRQCGEGSAAGEVKFDLWSDGRPRPSKPSAARPSSCL